MSDIYVVFLHSILKRITNFPNIYSSTWSWNKVYRFFRLGLITSLVVSNILHMDLGGAKETFIFLFSISSSIFPLYLWYMEERSLGLWYIHYLYPFYYGTLCQNNFLSSYHGGHCSQKLHREKLFLNQPVLN